MTIVVRVKFPAHEEYASRFARFVFGKNDLFGFMVLLTHRRSENKGRYEIEKQGCTEKGIPEKGIMHLNYLAYGSNLHPMRLMERVPSAELIGTTEIAGFELTFHKKSKDGSAKCNLLAVDEINRSVFAAIYRIDEIEKSALDEAEGRGYGYLDTSVSVISNGSAHTCFTYRAQPSHIVDHLKPYHWYKEMVVAGAEYLQFPRVYIDAVRAIDSVQDYDSERRLKNEALLERMWELR